MGDVWTSVGRQRRWQPEKSSEQNPAFQNGFRDSRSLAAVAASGSDAPSHFPSPPPPPPPPTPPIAMTAAPAMSDWVLSDLTFVGVDHSMEHLVSLNTDLALGDDEAFTMKYIDGLRLCQNFQSSADVNNFLGIYSDWFSEFSEDGSLLDRFDRLAWVKVTTLEAKDVSLGRACILTDRRNRIEEEIPVVFEGRVMKIGITEYDECWSQIKPSSQNVPAFSSDSDDDDDDEDGLSDTMMEEEDESDGDNDDHVLSDTVSVAGEADLEGEFRVDDVEVVAESKLEAESGDSSSLPADSYLPAAIDLGVEVGIGNDVHASPTCVHGEVRPVFDSSVDHCPAHSATYVDIIGNCEPPPAVPGNVSPPPLPQLPPSPSFDLNSTPRPSSSCCSRSGFVLPSPLPPLSEIERTAEIGQIVGFMIDKDDAILVEAMGESSVAIDS
ncbi:hypothetical protein L1887_00596 [Cichorium endivia]|nr:hypothetical protein L1887_00596 [Cichorium endivia]